MKPVQTKKICSIGIAISICCMHCVIVSSDRQATAAACEVIRQQRVIEEQIHISTIAKELKKQTEELKAFTAKRRHTIEAAKARLAQATPVPFLPIPSADNNDDDQPVGPDLPSPMKLINTQEARDGSNQEP